VGCAPLANKILRLRQLADEDPQHHDFLPPDARWP
jgi:hypothetical protein